MRAEEMRGEKARGEGGSRGRNEMRKRKMRGEEAEREEEIRIIGMKLKNTMREIRRGHGEETKGKRG